MKVFSPPTCSTSFVAAVRIVSHTLLDTRDLLFEPSHFLVERFLDVQHGFSNKFFRLNFDFVGADDLRALVITGLRFENAIAFRE